MAPSPTIYHTTGLLQLIAVSEYKRQQPVGYFSLPLEIREMIMELVLAYGDVFLDKPKPKKPDHKPPRFKVALHHAIKTVSKHNDKHSKLTPILQPPGFQLLATCKQVCAEGHAVFYSSNCFFLPQGSVDHARNKLKTLQPQHFDRIKILGLDMSANDLTPANFEQAHHSMQLRYGHALTAKPNFVQGQQWAIVMTELLDAIWKRKLYLVVSTAPKHAGYIKYKVAMDPEELDLRNSAGSVGYNTEEDHEVGWPLELRNPVCYTAMIVRLHIADIVANEGWKALRKRVYKGGLDWSVWSA